MIPAGDGRVGTCGRVLCMGGNRGLLLVGATDSFDTTYILKT
jgi:hypothetical protein